jgi:hypothetical protein
LCGADEFELAMLYRTKLAGVYIMTGYNLLLALSMCVFGTLVHASGRERLMKGRAQYLTG